MELDPLERTAVSVVDFINTYDAGRTVHNWGLNFLHHREERLESLLGADERFDVTRIDELPDKTTQNYDQHPHRAPDSVLGLRLLDELNISFPISYKDSTFSELSLLSVVLALGGGMTPYYSVVFHDNGLDIPSHRHVRQKLQRYPQKPQGGTQNQRLSRGGAPVGRILNLLGIGFTGKTSTQDSGAKKYGLTLPSHLADIAEIHEERATWHMDTAHTLLKDAVAGIYFTSAKAGSPEYLRLPGQKSKEDVKKITGQVLNLFYQAFPLADISSPYDDADDMRPEVRHPDLPPIYSPTFRVAIEDHRRIMESFA